VALGMLFVAVLLFSGWQRVELRQHGYRVEQMERERANEEALNRQLRLDIETLKSPKRIEKLATEQLHLVAPETGAAVIVERVVPADPPAASIVASAQERSSERAGIR
jgi:cell division protein FtsL